MLHSSIAHSIICTRMFRGKTHSDWFNGIEILQGRWQHGEKVGYCYPSGLEKTLCKWDMYVPLVTKRLEYPPRAHSDIQLYAHVRNLFSRLNNLCLVHDVNFNPSSHALKINTIYIFLSYMFRHPRGAIILLLTQL